LVPNTDGTLTQSVSTFYSATIGRLGIEQNQNKSRLTTKDSLIAQMDSEQATTSGVSLDEEMTNMIKFENSYRASAKYITTVSQMMDVLMSLAT
jgi:flagellar hook-associated protein 1 FlgK